LNLVGTTRKRTHGPVVFDFRSPAAVVLRRYTNTSNNVNTTGTCVRQATIVIIDSRDGTGVMNISYGGTCRGKYKPRRLIKYRFFPFNELRASRGAARSTNYVRVEQYYQRTVLCTRPRARARTYTIRRTIRIRCQLRKRRIWSGTSYAFPEW